MVTDAPDQLFPVEADPLVDLLTPDAPDEAATDDPVTEPEETDAADETDEETGEDTDDTDDEEAAAGDADEEPTAEEPPAEDTSKRGVKRAIFRAVDRYLAAQTDEERKAILDRSSADERQQLKWLGERLAARQTQPSEAADDGAAWSGYEELERLAHDDPYAFGEQVRPGGALAARYQTWLSWLKELRDDHGLPLSANPTVAEVQTAVRAHNATYERQQRAQRERAFDPDAAYDAFAASEAWTHLTAEERDSADPVHFEGDAAARRLAMERQLGRLEERAALRAKRNAATAKVEAANGTARRAQELAADAPPKVAGGRVSDLTDSEIEERYIADPARYRAQYEALRKRRGWK